MRFFITVLVEQNETKHFVFWRNVYMGPNMTESFTSASVSTLYSNYVYLLFIHTQQAEAHPCQEGRCASAQVWAGEPSGSRRQQATL